jgi:hypothetical protein
MNNILYKQLIYECTEDLKSIGLQLPPGIRFEISTRLTRALGKCSWRGDKIIIKLSDALDYRVGRNVLMHEMLHAIAGFKCGHGGLWLTLASLVSSKLSHKYNIKRLASVEDLSGEVKNALEAKYQAKRAFTVTCTSCSSQSKVTSRHGIIKNPQNYRCRCGGKVLVNRD